ncbi:hypothetical protein ABW21_db0200562 [Orbilia brochopaga]|nr:hypothetical protein ABW21_db0200562 [Drechslerella brochopaga]
MAASPPPAKSPTQLSSSEPSGPTSQLSPLASLLYSALPPYALPFNIHHVSHPPTRCEPLYLPAVGQKAQRTTLTSHFLALSSSSTSILIYAIEVHVYSTRTRTTIFVSKADSTGFFPKPSTPRPTATPIISPIRVITTAFLQYLIDTTRRPGATTHVTLFARAQDQYLFPNSVRNEEKHVLSDIQLIRWWAKVLDPILTAPIAAKDGDASLPPPSGYILVPGLDRVDLRHVFPSQQWIHGHPYDDPSLPVRQCIPHFEDDPKSRFLDDLEEQGWRGISDMKGFWEAMTFRQDSKGGSLPSSPKKKSELPSDLASASTFTIASLLRNPETRSVIAKRASTLSSRASSFASSIADINGTGKFGRVLPKRDYDKLLASLLDSDFEGLKCATESSELWIKMAVTEKLPAKPASSDNVEPAAADTEETRVHAPPIRKRKSDGELAEATAGLNILQPRKKPKAQLEVSGTALSPEESAPELHDAEPVINILQPRKKETGPKETDTEAGPPVYFLRPRRKAKPTDQNAD